MVPIEYMQYDADVHLDFIVPEMLPRDYWGFPLGGKEPFRKIAARPPCTLISTKYLPFPV